LPWRLELRHQHLKTTPPRTGREQQIRRAREVLADAGWLFDDFINAKMRRRGLASPDDGDALALTFAYPVAKRDWAEERRFEEGLKRLRRWIV
jgi:hypothetical protein